MPASHDRLKSLFLAALDVPADRREGFVAAEAADDPGLRAAVVELLRFHELEGASAGGEPGDVIGAVAREAAAIGPDERIGPWRVLRLLGRGGMGVVVLAEREPGGPPAAVKRIATGLASAELVRRFDREIEVLSRLRHPGIARLLDHGTTEGPGGRQPYLALEYVEGRPLREAMAACRDVRSRVQLLARIAEAVSHAHEKGVVHRDLKPDNIIVRHDGTPVLLDFGVAAVRALEPSGRTELTRTGLLLGTPQYMSPEQVIGTPEAVGPPSDVYSLGMMAYEFLVARTPYDTREVSLHRAMVLILTAEPPRPGSLAPELRGDLEYVLVRALEKRPQDRYADAGRMADDLRAWLEGCRVTARPARMRRAERWLRRRTGGLVAAGLVLASMLGVALAARPAFDRFETRRLSALCADAWAAHLDLRSESRRPESVRAAQATFRRLQREVQAEDEPWADVLNRWVLFRLAECDIVLHEFDRDPVRLRRAAVLLRSCRDEFSEPSPSRVPVGPGAFRSSVLVDPRISSTEQTMAGVYQSLAALERPASQLARAATHQLAARTSLIEEIRTSSPPTDVESSSDLLGWRNGYGRILIERGSAMDSVTTIREGLALVHDVLARGGLPGDGMFQASVAQTLGVGLLRLAEHTRATALFDSARDAFRMAMAIRTPERPLHYAESSLGLVETMLEEAQARDDPAIRRPLLDRARSRVAALRAQIPLRDMRWLASELDEREAEVLAQCVLADAPGMGGLLLRADSLMRAAAAPERVRPGTVPAAWREYRRALLAAAFRHGESRDSSRRAAQARARAHLEQATALLAPEQDLRFARKLRRAYALAGLAVPEELVSVHPARP
jgi:predicted Ser/Thr protein kinase